MSELTLQEPFHETAGQIAVELPGARALFTTRHGGHSKPPYDTLNLGVLTDDAHDDVAANHRWLAQQFGVALAYGRQLHGSDVRVTAVGTEPQAPLIDADAIVTAAPGIAPMVLAADCLPIVIAADGAVAAVHAGWRGLAGDVIAHAVDAVRALLAPSSGPPALQAAIGPGAGICCYEVGPELHARFSSFGAQARQGSKLDLKAIARAQLAVAGVATVHDVELCTICAPRLFFSHRREHGLTGRQGAIVWLT